MEKPSREDVLSSYKPHEILSMALDAFVDRVRATGPDADRRRVEIGRRDLDTAVRMLFVQKMRDAGREVPGLANAATTRTTPEPIQQTEPWLR